jgi:hypothetical protein
MWLIAILGVFAFSDVCVREKYDEKAKDVFSVKFQGQHNGFWSYVSDDPKSWTFAFRRIDAKAIRDVEHDAHIEIGTEKKIIDLSEQLQFKEGRVIIPETKVREAIAAMTNSLNSAKVKAPSSYPSIQNQTIKLHIIFEDTETTSAEEHVCTLGFGTNSISITPESSFNNKKFEIKLNGLSESDKENFEVGLKTTAQYIFSKAAMKIEGLPWGTYILFNGKEAQAGSNNLAYLNGLKKSCQVSVKKSVDKKSKWPWTIAQNTCSELK